MSVRCVYAAHPIQCAEHTELQRVTTELALDVGEGVTARQGLGERSLAVQSRQIRHQCLLLVRHHSQHVQAFFSQSTRLPHVQQINIICFLILLTVKIKHPSRNAAKLSSSEFSKFPL